MSNTEDIASDGIHLDLSDEADPELDLPKFINHIPNAPDEIDFTKMEDVEKFIETLDRSEPTSCGAISIEELAKIQEHYQKTSQSFEALKVQNDQLKVTASSCRKVISKSLESRREATEAIKHLNEKTQHVLDDNVDDELLSSVEKTLSSAIVPKKEAIDAKPATTGKNGIQLDKVGKNLKVMYHDKDVNDTFFVVLSSNEDDKKYVLVESSHELSGLEEMVSDLNTTSDWPRFYVSLKKGFLEVTTDKSSHT